MSKRIIRMAIIVLSFLVITTLGIVWKSWASSPVLLSEEKVVQMVLEQYPGEIIRISLKNDAYIIEIQLEKGLYELWVDADDGAIRSIIRLVAVDHVEIIPEEEPIDTVLPGKELPDKVIPEQEPEPVQEPDVAEPTKTPTSDADKESSTLVTRDKAALLSQKQVPGTVHNMELKGTDISKYYLVQIHTVDGREAVVQVNGISGAIMSVTWDDNMEDVEQEDNKNVKTEKTDKTDKTNNNANTDRTDNSSNTDNNGKSEEFKSEKAKINNAS